MRKIVMFILALAMLPLAHALPGDVVLQNGTAFTWEPVPANNTYLQRKRFVMTEAERDTHPLARITVPRDSIQFFEATVNTAKFWRAHPDSHFAFILSGTVATPEVMYNTGIGFVLGNVRGCFGFMLERFDATATTYPHSCISIEHDTAYKVRAEVEQTRIITWIYQHKKLTELELILGVDPWELIGTAGQVMTNPNPLQAERRDIIIFPTFIDAPTYPIRFSDVTDGFIRVTE